MSLISRSCGNIAQVPKARGQYSRNWGK